MEPIPISEVRNKKKQKKKDNKNFPYHLKGKVIVVQRLKINSLKLKYLLVPRLR